MEESSTIPSSPSDNPRFDERPPELHTADSKILHELNNLLMLILAHSELIPLKAGNTEALEAASKEIRTAVMRARELSRELKPILQAWEKAGADPSAVPTTAHRRQKTILIVDDEPAVALFVKTLLTQQGYLVRTTASAEDALSIFREEHPHLSLVIADFTMPHMNGAMMLSEMAKIDPSVPSVLSTGVNVATIARGYTIPGLRGFLDKPYGRDELLRTIETASRSIP